MFKKLISLKEVAAAILIVALSVLVIAGPRWMRLYQTEALTVEETVDIYLEQESPPDSLVTLLQNKEVLKNRKELKWAIQTQRWNEFKVGHYRLEPGTSYNDLLSKLGKGIQDPIKLTILPGRTESRLIKTISNSFRFDSLALKQTLSDSLFLARQGTDSAKVIGKLYPATYDFYWTTSPQKVIERLLNTFENNISSKFDERLQELDKSLNEILALASIIEWEAGVDKEKATISGLYWNRLKKGMRLQADPTVNYAVGQRRRLTYKDYKVEHPYNTYLHAGLPPGPITNPSRSSIKAALYPADHDFLYMVASPEGTHNFSKTYSEHRRKSREWREWLQKQYRIKRQREKDNQK